MTAKQRYFVKRYPSGGYNVIFRVHQGDDFAAWGELWVRDHWEKHETAREVLFSDDAEEISEAEALALARAAR
jgi:hypothetical protein